MLGKTAIYIVDVIMGFDLCRYVRISCMYYYTTLYIMMVHCIHRNSEFINPFSMRWIWNLSYYLTFSIDLGYVNVIILWLRPYGVQFGSFRAPWNNLLVRFGDYMPVSQALITALCEFFRELKSSMWHCIWQIWHSLHIGLLKLLRMFWGWMYKKIFHMNIWCSNRIL